MAKKIDPQIHFLATASELRPTTNQARRHSPLSGPTFLLSHEGGKTTNTIHSFFCNGSSAASDNQSPKDALHLVAHQLIVLSTRNHS